MFIKNIEGRYIISDFEIKKMKELGKEDDLIFESYGTFAERYIYILSKKVFSTLEIFGPRLDMPVSTLSGVKILGSNINFHTDSVEYKLNMLGELIAEIDSSRKNVLESTYCIPFRNKIKKYPDFMFGVGEDVDGVENFHCIKFKDNLLKMMLYMQKWSSHDFCINEMEKLEFIEDITYDLKVKIKNYKRIYLDDIEVTREEFLNIFNDFIYFINFELKEMNFKFLEVEFKEDIKWEDLSS